MQFFDARTAAGAIMPFIFVPLVLDIWSVKIKSVFKTRNRSGRDIPTEIIGWKWSRRAAGRKQSNSVHIAYWFSYWKIGQFQGPITQKQYDPRQNLQRISCVVDHAQKGYSKHPNFAVFRRKWPFKTFHSVIKGLEEAMFQRRSKVICATKHLGCHIKLWSWS